MAQYKVNLTFPPELMREIDDYCKHNYLTRSRFVQLASASYLYTHKMTKALSELSELVRRLSDREPRTDKMTKALSELSELVRRLSDREPRTEKQEAK